MRYFCYQLGVYHSLPESVAEVFFPGRPLKETRSFRLEMPIGLAVLPDTDADKWWLHLLDCPDAFFWEILLASVHDKLSFLNSLETIGYPLCVRRDQCDLYGDVEDMLDFRQDELQIAYDQACRALYRHVYGRN